MGGFGTSPFGTSPYGVGAGGISGALFIVSGVAETTNTVRVSLSTAPKAVSATAPGDALNPATWSIKRLDTNATFTILEVVPVLSDLFDISILQSLAPFSVTHEVRSTTLTQPSGALIVDPKFADFPGVAVQTQTLSQQASPYVDLANPPTPSRLGALSGTLIINSGGDYESVSGIELIRKCIIRRLTTPTGGFSHLPNYGIGLPLKQPVPTTQLISMRSDVIAQALREPDVSSADASIVIDAANDFLQITVSAIQASTNQQFTVSTNIPLSSGS